MNKIKQKGQELQQLVTDASWHLDVQKAETAGEGCATERERIKAAEPYRWVAIAKTDFQSGLMALTRAVAQPTSF